MSWQHTSINYEWKGKPNLRARIAHWINPTSVEIKNAIIIHTEDGEVINVKGVKDVDAYNLHIYPKASISDKNARNRLYKLIRGLRETNETNK